jgi:hypothetical protein
LDKSFSATFNYETEVGVNQMRLIKKKPCHTQSSSKFFILNYYAGAASASEASDSALAFLGAFTFGADYLFFTTVVQKGLVVIHAVVF